MPVVLDSKGIGDIEHGDLAVVRTGRGRAQVEQRLGPADHVENVLEALLVERGARQPFEPHTAPDPELTIANRVDLRDLLTYTIDPDTAKDFDDALSFRREDDGIRAWVHIADVSYFVGAGTPLDHGRRAPRLLDVRARARSRRCCRTSSPTTSARCGRTRTGSASRSRSRRTASRSFYRSVIRSDARLTYGQAQRREAEPHILEALDLNDELAQSLRAQRFARGALQVQTPEVVFRFDGHGGVADAWLEGEPHAHMLVEELMILANELVGAFLAGRRREALYRVHEQPDPLAVEHLLAKLADLGVPTPPVPERMTPQQAAKLAGADLVARSPSTSSSRGAGARRSRRSCCARSSRRATTRATSATPASRARRTRTSPRRSAATPT